MTAVVISTQHSPEADQKQITEYVREELGPKALGNWWNKSLTLFVNPTGSFIHGGPSADAGVTGRKIIVDSYGGWGRHGGGAFSGKDPSKVDRSSAYFCRYVAKQVVAAGFAKKAEIQVGYAIGMAKPVSVKVDTFGTGDERAAAEFVMNAFDFRPRAIIDKLNLLRPIYRRPPTTATSAARVCRGKPSRRRPPSRSKSRRSPKGRAYAPGPSSVPAVQVPGSQFLVHEPGNAEPNPESRTEPRTRTDTNQEPRTSTVNDIGSPGPFAFFTLFRYAF